MTCHSDPAPFDWIGYGQVVYRLESVSPAMIVTAENKDASGHNLCVAFTRVRT